MKRDQDLCKKNTRKTQQMIKPITFPSALNNNHPFIAIIQPHLFISIIPEPLDPPNLETKLIHPQFPCHRDSDYTFLIANIPVHISFHLSKFRILPRNHSNFNYFTAIEIPTTPLPRELQSLNPASILQKPTRNFFPQRKCRKKRRNIALVMASISKCKKGLITSRRKTSRAISAISSAVVNTGIGAKNHRPFICAIL